MSRSSQHGLVKVKLCMMNLIRGLAWWLREEQWSCFIKTFDTGSHNILLDKLMMCGLGKRLKKWTDRSPVRFCPWGGIVVCISAVWLESNFAERLWRY